MFDTEGRGGEREERGRGKKKGESKNRKEDRVETRRKRYNATAIK